MADLFGVKLVTATIARISQDCAQRCQGLTDALRDHVAAAPVKHMDETGCEPKLCDQAAAFDDTSGWLRLAGAGGLAASAAQ